MPIRHQWHLTVDLRFNGSINQFACKALSNLLSYCLMIETNFDNCVGPLHCVCRTKFFSWDREKALPIDQSQSKEISCVSIQGPLYTNWNTTNFVQWPLLKYVTRELKVCRGTTQLEQFNNYFPRPFYRECLLNDYIIYLRTYEK